MIENTLFNENWSGKKCLVIVPHQDDEINIAGSFIPTFLANSGEVYIVYSTNGDYSIKAEVRQKEAIQALQWLGVKQSNIIFLGYGDTFNRYSKGHIFTTKKGVFVSPANYTETYCNDYAYQKRGKHNKYTYKNFYMDIKDVVLDIRPDLIVCVDCDGHQDHRALSLCLEAIVGDLLKAELTYQPLLYKAFAYSIAYDGVRDYYNENLPESTYVPNEDIIGISMYQWSSRLRFPVPVSCRTDFIRSNLIYKALREHKTQYACDRVECIANSDIVFFQKRTDNLALLAKISVSSNDGYKSYINDFSYFGIKALAANTLEFAGGVWSPINDDIEPKMSLSWENPIDIKQIRLFFNIVEKLTIEEIRVSFNQGSKYVYKNLILENGAPYEINCHEKNITNCIITIVCNEPQWGIAECEIFADQYQKSFIKPFIKIKVEDNFVYTYKTDRTQIELSSYTFNINPSDENIIYEIIDGEGYIDDNVVHLSKSKCVTVKAYLQSNPKIYDVIQIRKKRFIDDVQNKVKGFVSHAMLRSERRVQKIRRKYFMKKNLRI